MNSKLLLGAAATLALGLGTPALAQSAGSNVNGGRGDTSVRTEQNNINLNASRTSTEVSNVTKVSNSNRSMNLSYADNSQRNGNLRLVADQSLNQSISNRGASSSGCGDCSTAIRPNPARAAIPRSTASCTRRSRASAPISRRSPSTKRWPSCTN